MTFRIPANSGVRILENGRYFFPISRSSQSKPVGDNTVLQLLAHRALGDLPGKLVGGKTRLGMPLAGGCLWD